LELYIGEIKNDDNVDIIDLYGKKYKLDGKLCYLEHYIPIISKMNLKVRVHFGNKNKR
jgi:hypothetical protein